MMILMVTEMSLFVETSKIDGLLKVSSGLNLRFEQRV